MSQRIVIETECLHGHTRPHWGRFRPDGQIDHRYRSTECVDGSTVELVLDEMVEKGAEAAWGTTATWEEAKDAARKILIAALGLEET